MKNTTRREALMVIAGATLGALPIVARAEGKGNKGEAVAWVKPGEGMAASVKYVEKSADKTKFCKDCALYKDAGKKGDQAAGSCSLFPNQFVHAEASCASFAKKA